MSKVDVLARQDARIASAQSLQSDAYWVQELPRLIEEREAIDDTIANIEQALRWLDQPGTPTASRRESIAKILRASLARIGGDA